MDLSSAKDGLAANEVVDDTVLVAVGVEFAGRNEAYGLEWMRCCWGFFGSVMEGCLCAEAGGESSMGMILVLFSCIEAGSCRW